MNLRWRIWAYTGANCSDFLNLLELRLHAVCTVRELLDRIITEENRIGQPQAQEDTHGQFAYLGLGMGAGTHLDDVPPRARIACYHYRSLCLVGQHRTCRLLHLFAQIGSRFRAEDTYPRLLH